MEINGTENTIAKIYLKLPFTGDINDDNKIAINGVNGIIYLYFLFFII